MRFTLLSLSVLFVTSALASQDLDREAHDHLEKRASASVITTCKNKGQFALTFDDGPYPLHGNSIEAILESYGAKGTFFVNGYNWDCIYNNAATIQKRYKAGHQIAAHTWGHDDITTLNDRQLNEQITLVETALMKIIGVKPAFFRPPYGSYNAHAVALIKKRGYNVVTWDFDSGDSAGASTNAQVKAYSKLYRKYPAPHIALNHETYATTPGSITKVVPRLVQAGYKLVTVAQCLNLAPYQSTTKSFKPKPNSSWTCAGTPGPGAPGRRG